jgi:subtilisin family serine protease
VAAVALAATALAGDGARHERAQAWRSAFAPRHRLALENRVIVVLAAPSLADRTKARGTLPPPRAQRRFVQRADALQRRLLAALRAQGVRLRRVEVYTRTLNGFSTVVDARALAALERAPGVAGVYPVRAVYPAALPGTSGDVPAGGAPPVSLPGSTGRGVTVALLDGGVDRTHPALAGRVRYGIDLVGGGSDTAPRRGPGGAHETHGTRIAALVVGHDPAGGVHGVAPGARLLPIRVLGWQRAADGAVVEAGRADVLLAGLERAVDPDRDGDVEDAARVALVPLVEPYASFPDSPEARAVAGATGLGTLVVAAAGNDGPGGAGGAGTVGSPAAAPAALAVGALDARAATRTVHVRAWLGGALAFDGTVPLLGGEAPARPLAIAAAAPARTSPGGRLAVGLRRSDYLDGSGSSRAAGRAVLVPGDGADVAARAAFAARAGARALVVYGTLLPGGALGDASLPTVALPAAVGRTLRGALAAGRNVRVELSAAAPWPNADAGRVAAFSSGGLTVGGAAKPELVAPGVGLPTADPGGAPGRPRYARATGTSAAAAVVAGAAALVASVNPSLDAADLRAALVGSARPVAADPTAPVAVAGAGEVDPVAADAAELVVTPATLALGRAPEPGRPAVVPLRVRNVGVRPLVAHLGLAADHGTATLRFAAAPNSVELAPGEERVIRVVVSASASTPGPATLSGVLVVVPQGGPAARVPWAAAVPAPSGAALSAAALSATVVRAGASSAAVLSFTAGSVTATPDGPLLHPVERLDVELWRGSSRLGTLATLRDLLPGRYALGLTGRAPGGAWLRPGSYRVRLVARRDVAGEGRPGAAVTSLRFAVVQTP